MLQWLPVGADTKEFKEIRFMCRILLNDSDNLLKHLLLGL